jgi:23S rRNA U2552 (ribose-2'-O)-methylase RlmE/FtsJ
MDIEVKEEKQKIPFLKIFFLILSTTLLGILMFFLVFQRAYFFSGMSQILGLYDENILVYDTFTISFSDTVDSSFKNNVMDVLKQISYEDTKRFQYVDAGGDILISNVQNTQENDLVLSQSYILPVGHIYWIRDDYVSTEKDIYVGNNGDLNFLTDLGYSPVVKEDILEELEGSESTIGFVEIQDLTPDYRVLSLDGKYFLDDLEGGIKRDLITRIQDVDNIFILNVVKKNILDLLDESFNEENIAKVNMTGVTAISRDLAAKIESSGNDEYPAENIAEFLADADLTHTSNEVSFVEGCTPGTSMRFCSAPEYLATLLVSGIDVVELTGNHNNDYGASNNTSTIQTYIDNGMDYFGGGLDDDDASEILYKEVNGNKIAFLGYNYYDTMLGTGALATSSHAGANSYSSSKMKNDIEEARENADVVIVDFQFQECYSYPSSDIIYPICYRPLSSPDQKGVFRLAIDYGADIVIGTQAHQPQTYELYEDGIIFYGLGNLFFDQTPWIGTRQGMVLTHYFYNGSHIQTKITPTIYDNDMQTRLATEEEGDLLLELLKDAR